MYLHIHIYIFMCIIYIYICIYIYIHIYVCSTSVIFHGYIQISEGTIDLWNGDYEMFELPLNGTFSLGSTLSFLEKNRSGRVWHTIHHHVSTMLAPWLWMGVDRSLPNQMSM